jgi:hypothetical protein
MSNCFRVKTPDNNTLNLYYNKNDTKDIKYKILQKVIFNYVIGSSKFYKELKEINDTYKNDDRKQKIKELKFKYRHYSLYNYCLDKWIWQHKFEEGKLNHEDKVKMLLDRCGTFLLMGQFKNGMIIDDGRKGKVINNIEIPVSNTSSEIEDLFYSSGADEEYTEQSEGNNIIWDNEVILGNIDLDENKEKESNKKKRVAYFNMIKKIYKQDDIDRPVLYKLKNIDIYNSDPQGLSEEEVKKWRGKPFKNIHNENLYEVRRRIYKGYEGYVDKSRPYIWEWSVVNTDNMFEFNGQKWKIDKGVKEYMCNPDNQCEMDKILCYKQDENYYFFDQKINNISKYVKMF